MIIFNLWAVPVGAAIVFIYWGLQSILPVLKTPPANGWALALVTVAIGGITEVVGIKARVFFLPIWLIGVGLVSYELGVAGTVVFFVVVIGVMIWIRNKTKKQEENTWQKLCTQTFAPAPAFGADEKLIWAWVKNSLYLPVVSDYTADVCEHDLRVLNALKGSGVPLNQEERATVAAQEAFLVQAKAAGQPPGAESKVQRAMERLVAERLATAEIKAATTSKVSPPPSAGSTPTTTGPVDFEAMWGGYYISLDPNSNRFTVFRLLDFNQTAYHAALYRETFSHMPTLTDVLALKPGIGHAPLAARGLLNPPVHLIGARPLVAADLEGYMIYLEAHETPPEARAALEAKLIGFSREAPMHVQLSLVNDQLPITPRKT